MPLFLSVINQILFKEVKGFYNTLFPHSPVSAAEH